MVSVSAGLHMTTADLYNPCIEEERKTQSAWLCESRTCMWSNHSHRCSTAPQVQGVLTSAAESWPHIHISDSLVMADSAIKMAAEGCTSVAVLGVDFMSENVRAILDEAGYQHVQVSNPSHNFFENSSFSSAAEELMSNISVSFLRDSFIVTGRCHCRKTKNGLLYEPSMILAVVPVSVLLLHSIVHSEP